MSNFSETGRSRAPATFLGPSNLKRSSAAYAMETVTPIRLAKSNEMKNEISWRRQWFPPFLLQQQVDEMALPSNWYSSSRQECLFLVFYFNFFWYLIFFFSLLRGTLLIMFASSGALSWISEILEFPTMKFSKPLLIFLF